MKSDRVWVISGTSDGSRVIGHLKGAGAFVLASATTDYGAALAKEAGADVVEKGPLDREAMEGLIEGNGITTVIDASHPFAVEVSKNAMAAAEKTGARYIRFERPSVKVEGDDIVPSPDFKTAAKRAFEEGERILYTAGTNNLELFVKEAGARNKELFARVLYTPDIVEKALSLGLPRENIIAAVGPFSREDNLAHLKKFNCDCLVTKESGAEGGFPEKIEAAREMGVKVMVIDRPKLDYPVVVSRVEDLDKIIQ